VVFNVIAGKLEGRALSPAMLNDVQWSGPSILNGGDQLHLAHAQLLVLNQQPLPALRVRPRREYEAVLHAVFTGRQHVSLLFAHLPATRNRTALVNQVLGVLPEAVWVSDLGPNTLEILLIGISAEEREALAKGLVAAGCEHVEGASRPEDGETLDDVVEVAFARHLKITREAAEDAYFADPTMLRLLSAVESVQSNRKGWVLIGERGVGKEAFARQAHARIQPGMPFVSISRPPTPGALAAEASALSSGGTLYIGARGEMPTGTSWADWERAASGAARWFWGTERPPRGATWSLPVPALRDRPGDVLPLADAMLARFSRAAGRSALTLSTSAREALRMHEFPGNVRELANVMASVSLSSAGSEIALDSLPSHVQRSSVFRAMEGLRGALRETERETLLSTLARTRWNVTRAAQLLGIPRRTVVYRMARLGLRRPERS
jgi:hypothetical protein